MTSKQAIDSALVNEELSRILKTPHFRSSKILSTFLRYIVTQTLEGNEQCLKEYVIGTEVLKKGPDFNPQLDAIVRIHARRLRKLIEEYYNSQGINDPITISVPTGRYIPVFESNNSHQELQETSISKDHRDQAHPPKIAIVPLTKTMNNERLDIICSSLCRDLSIELSKYQELSVISNYSVQMVQNHGSGMDEIIKRLEPDYLLMTTCEVMEDDFNFTIELHAVSKSQLIWADSYEISDYEHHALQNYRDIIEQVVSNISGFLGIIYKDLLSENHIPNDYDYMYAIYWHNKYHNHFSMKAFLESNTAIDSGLQKNPDNSLLNSIKAQLLLDRRTSETDFAIDPLNEGLNYAVKSASLDQNNQHAWLMIAWAYIMKHNKAKSEESIKKCLSINPNNSLYQSSSGFAFVCIGAYDKGWEQLLKAVQTTYYFWVANPAMCLYHIRKENFEEAYYWANLIKRPDYIWDPLLRACCAGHLQNRELITESTKELISIAPDFTEKATKLIDVFLLDKELQGIILEGLQKAGIRLD